MTVTYTTLTVARAPSTVTFTVRGNLGAIVGGNIVTPPTVDLVLTTEAGDYLTTDTGDYLAYA